MVSWARLSGSAARSNLIYSALGLQPFHSTHTQLLLHLLGAAAAIVDPKVNAVSEGGEDM